MVYLSSFIVSIRKYFLFFRKGENTKMIEEILRETTGIKVFIIQDIKHLPISDDLNLNCDVSKFLSLLLKVGELGQILEPLEPKKVPTSQLRYNTSERERSYFLLISDWI